MKDIKTLCIIPARGGSKRIKNKNIKMFIDRPIIGYAINAAKKSKIFDEIMVSTDSKKIKAITEQYGAQVPFLRSKKTSDDYAVLADVILEVLNEYKKRNKEFDYCCCMLPTGVFITYKDLRESFNFLKNETAFGVISVASYPHPIERALEIKGQYLKMIYPKNKNKRTQDCKKTYFDAGQFYFLNVKKFLKEKKLFGKKVLPYIIDIEKVEDIDTKEDWKRAELKYKYLKKK